jgi:hypothetical protein
MEVVACEENYIPRSSWPAVTGSTASCDISRLPEALRDEHTYFPRQLNNNNKLIPFQPVPNP